jgi:hypothetical protein
MKLYYFYFQSLVHFFTHSRTRTYSDHGLIKMTKLKLKKDLLANKSKFLRI